MYVKIKSEERERLEKHFLQTYGYGSRTKGEIRDAAESAAARVQEAYQKMKEGAK